MSNNRYSFFPGDYLRDTLHLGWYEDLAYRRLLDLYYSRGRPIANNRAYIMRAVRANEPEQQNAVDAILEEFFELKSDGWHNKKADAELSFYADKSHKSSESANLRWEKERARKNKDLSDAFAMRSQCDGNAPTPTRKPNTVGCDFDVVGFNVPMSSTTVLPGAEKTASAPRRRNGEKAKNPKIEYDSTAIQWIGISPDQNETWEQAYPAIDIHRELMAAAAWVDANPKNRKANWCRFLTNWLSRAQERAGRLPINGRTR